MKTNWKDGEILMQIDNLRVVQKRELDVLRAIIEICERHGFRYFAVGGTCLGAVRHKGFIPWDDDIDIGMPRKDFDQFREVAKHELPKHLSVNDFEELQHSNRLYIKVYDNTTTFVEKNCEKFSDQYTGIFVDIFPYDGLPSGSIRRKFNNFRMKVLSKLSFYRRMPYFSMNKLSDKILFFLIYPLKWLLPFNWASKKIEEILRMYPLEKSLYSIAAGYYVFKSHYFLETKKIRFEDLMMPCPEDFDGYLTDQYGDYMQLPPIEKRRTDHDLLFFSLDEPYTKYIKNKQ
ncbi:LicD family protein [Clostridium sp. MSJ-11]|uniref:LicD family protein n=1 Tax=Clostridium mobile TaxID=2841512 RepID=A0ABS6EL62_9CLOT|nr:LicD family protein [Clostridium mobile]MBU5485765.1 LicD family protein [Clostridium mobile]